MASERFSVEEVKVALEASGAIRLGAALKLGCAPNTIKNYIDKYPELQDAEREIKANNLDIAETELLKAVRAGKPWAICFYLKCMGKERGWTERRELTGKNGEDLPAPPASVAIFQLPDNERG